MTVRPCAQCGEDFEARNAASKYCGHRCSLDASNARRRIDTPPESECENCGETFQPHMPDQKCCSSKCSQQLTNNSRYTPAMTRRCRNMRCPERFVPVNPQHWYHEPACATVPAEDKWGVDDILREEGSLTPESSHFEMAKAAFGQKNQALRKVTQLSSLREYLTSEIRSFHDENPQYRYPQVPRPPKQKLKKGPREVLLQLSDWQIVKWEEGFGVEGTLRRVEQIKASTAAIVQRQMDAGYPIRKITVSFGGDMIEGCYIYRGQNVTGLDKTSNTHRLTTQVRTAANEMADMAAFCATLVDSVDVQLVGGNHGRPNGPNDYADPEDNFDVMAGWWAADLTANNKRITWTCHENWWGGFEVMGHPVVSFHGDQWTGKSDRLEVLLPQWIANGEFDAQPAIVLTHHRHSEWTADVASASVYQNGTIDGGSKWYTTKYGRRSRPHQRILVVSESHAPEADFPIHFPAHD